MGGWEDEEYCDPEIYYCDDGDESDETNWNENPIQPYYPSSDRVDQSRNNGFGSQQTEASVEKMIMQGNRLNNEFHIGAKLRERVKTRLFLRWARNQIAKEEMLRISPTLKRI